VDSGKLIFPGDKMALKPFVKEMKRLRANWVSTMSRRYYGVRDTYRLADLSDALIDTYLEDGTAATMEMIFNLDRGQDETYEMMIEATQIMGRYGAALYNPEIGGTRDPSAFLAESQEILAERQRRMDAWLEANKHRKDGTPPF
jgi:hypothetical protein